MFRCAVGGRGITLTIQKLVGPSLRVVHSPVSLNPNVFFGTAHECNAARFHYRWLVGFSFRTTIKFSILIGYIGVYSFSVTLQLLDLMTSNLSDNTTMGSPILFYQTTCIVGVDWFGVGSRLAANITFTLEPSIVFYQGVRSPKSVLFFREHMLCWSLLSLQNTFAVGGTLTSLKFPNKLIVSSHCSQNKALSAAEDMIVIHMYGFARVAKFR